MRTRITGIYKITNQTNDKVYIGKSVDMFTRWRHHERELQRGKHCNVHLQKSWNKYGENTFKFEVVEVCDEKLLKDREMYWMGVFNSLKPEWGYNIADESKETKDKHLNNKNSEGKGREQIYQLSLQNEVIKVWSSTSEVAEFLKETAQQFSKHLFGSSNGIGKKNKAITKIAHKGFVWVKESMYEEGKEYYPKTFSRSTKGNALKGGYLVLNTLGKITYSFSTKAEVANHFNTTEAVISVASSTEEVWRGVRIVREGNYDEAKDYSFTLPAPKYTEVLYKIQNTVTQEIIKISNISQTAKNLGMNDLKLRMLLKGERKRGSKVYKFEKYKEWIKIPL